MSDLQLTSLTKRFGDVVAVDDVTLQAPEGSFVTLLGPSGCGKTTTLRLLAGFERPTSGTISFGGKRIDTVPANRREMALVFQSYALFPHMSVYDNVAYGLRVRKVSAVELGTRVRDVLQLVGLETLASRAPHQLSGGQQQRVALARALVIRPRVLLFDEPLSNLDAKLRVQMRDEIRRLQRKLGVTAIYVTHDQAEAMALSDLVVVMNRGRVEQVASPFDIYARPATRFVADFVGHANFLSGEILDRANGQVTVRALGRNVELPENSRIADVSKGKAILLVVRPEMLRLGEADEGWRGVISRATFLGTQAEYEIEFDGVRMLAVDGEPMRHGIRHEGEQVVVSIQTSGVYALPEIP